MWHKTPWGGVDLWALCRMLSVGREWFAAIPWSPDPDLAMSAHLARIEELRPLIPAQYCSKPLILDANLDVLDDLPPDGDALVPVTWDTALESGSHVFTAVYAPLSVDQTMAHTAQVRDLVVRHLCPVGGALWNSGVDYDVYMPYCDPAQVEAVYEKSRQWGARFAEERFSELPSWLEPLEFKPNCEIKDDVAPWCGVTRDWDSANGQASAVREVIVWVDACFDPCDSGGFPKLVGHAVRTGYMGAGGAPQIDDVIWFMMGNGGYFVDLEAQPILTEREALHLDSRGEINVEEMAQYDVEAEEPQKAPESGSLHAAIIQRCGSLFAARIGTALLETVPEDVAEAILNLSRGSVVGIDCERVAGSAHTFASGCPDTDTSAVIDIAARQMAVLYAG